MKFMLNDCFIFEKDRKANQNNIPNTKIYCIVAKEREHPIQKRKSKLYGNNMNNVIISLAFIVSSIVTFTISKNIYWNLTTTKKIILLQCFYYVHVNA